MKTFIAAVACALATITLAPATPRDSKDLFFFEMNTDEKEAAAALTRDILLETIASAPAKLRTVTLVVDITGCVEAGSRPIEALGAIYPKKAIPLYPTGAAELKQEIENKARISKFRWHEGSQYWEIYLKQPEAHILESAEKIGSDNVLITILPLRVSITRLPKP